MTDSTDGASMPPQQTSAEAGLPPLPDSGERSTHIRYLVLLFVALAAASAYLTRHCLAVANKSMQEELGINNEQFGYLYSAFSLGYVLFQVPGGWVGQKFGTRQTMAAISVIWSGFTMLTAVVTTLPALILTRFGFGLAQSGLIPNQSQVVRDWFPIRQRGTASSMVTMSMSIGGVASMGLTVWLMKYYHWRTVFQLYFLVGIVWSIAFYLIFRSKPKDHPWVNDRELSDISGGSISRGTTDAPPEPLNWGEILGSRNTWWLCIQGICRNVGYNLFVTYLPVLLQDAFDLDVQGAGYFTTWPLIGVVLGALAGGRIVDIVLVKTRSHRLSRGAVGFTVLALCGFFTAASVWSANGYTILGLTPAQQFAGCNAIAAFFFGISAPCAWAATIDLGRDNTAVLTGFLNAAGNMAGVLITPLVGMLLDYLLQFEGSWIWLIHLHAAFHVAAAVTWWPIRLPEPHLEADSKAPAA